MNAANGWTIAEPDLDSVIAARPFPLDDLAAGSIPAIVLREVYPPTRCRRLIDRLVAEDLLYASHDKVPDRFREKAIPEGYYREGSQAKATHAWRAKTAEGRARIDVGTSLGYRGSDREAFFAHSQETHALLERLFDDGDDPIGLLYDALEKLSRNKRVATAREADGRKYGPAIIRAHYGGYAYQPHFDSVRLREKRADYAVHAFAHQFAGVLVLQNARADDRTAQCVLHRCLWSPEVDPHLRDGTFHEFARRRRIESVEARLNPGDLYFFNTRSIHEVPGVAGRLPRVVLATFIGYDADRDEIFVWS